MLCVCSSKNLESEHQWTLEKEEGKVTFGDIKLATYKD
jgi:hypothetical protein